MKQVIEGMLAIVFLMLFLFVGMELIHAQIDALDARDFRNYSVEVLENSGLDTACMDRLIEEAGKRGYKMDFVMYLEDGERMVYLANDDVSKEILNIEFEITYNITIPILKRKLTHTIVGITA